MMPGSPVRTLSVTQKGSRYVVCERDDQNPLYSIIYTHHPRPRMTVLRATRPDEVVGKASYQTTKRYFSRISQISLDFPSASNLAFNEKGGILNSTRRNLQSPALGQTRFESQVGANPWKGGAPETTFINCVSTDGQSLSVFKDERYDIKRIGQMEIQQGLRQDQFDELVVCTMAILLVERRG